MEIIFTILAILCVIAVIYAVKQEIYFHKNYHDKKQLNDDDLYEDNERPGWNGEI